MLTKTRARSTTKIRSKNNLYPYRHFTEHLVDTFGKLPRVQFGLENLESFDPVTQELYRPLPATIHPQHK
jgi:hypothetical protein